MNQDAFDKGLKTRREVLGADYVDAAIKNADDFNRPLQELVTQYCWNDIWNRPGLDRRTRSLINLAMLTALNRPHELKLHVRGAINNGLTKDEIREVLLQTAIYCGVPAAIDSFRGAKEVFQEMGDQDHDQAHPASAARRGETPAPKQGSPLRLPPAAR